MSIQIDGLSGSISLIDSVEMIYPRNGYVNVSAYERIRISVYASTIVRVQLEWSPDGHRSGIMNMYRCGSNMWKCDFVEVVMPFLRIHIINDSGRPCDELFVHTWSPGVTTIKEESLKDNDETPRSKLPLKFFSKPKAAYIPHQPGDNRLPEYIPQGCILVGGDKGKITILPRGNVGEYLMMGEQGPVYKLPYPPTQLSKQSEDALELWKN